MRDRLLHQLIDAQPGHLIRRAHQRSTAVFMDETREFDITPPQYVALVTIGQNPGIDATRLSEQVAFDRATIGSILDRLEKKGLVLRKPHSSDRRTKENFLTPAGKRMIETLAEVMPRVATRTLKRLKPAEQKQLMTLLARLVEPDSDD